MGLFIFEVESKNNFNRKVYGFSEFSTAEFIKN